MVCYVYCYMNENIHLLDTGNFLGNFLSYCANGVTKQLHNDLSAQGLYVNMYFMHMLHSGDVS